MNSSILGTGLGVFLNPNGTISICLFMAYKVPGYSFHLIFRQEQKSE
jgi:hypothetical protein